MNEEEYVKKLEKELRDLKEQHAAQRDMHEMTTLYLKKLQEDLLISEQKLSETNKDLTDSINYAKRIQDAFVVQRDSLRKILPESFIFLKPKDILCGDFVWVSEHHSQIYLAVGDCTGHGVPGAMLSIFVISILNQIINHYAEDSPARVLERMDELMQKNLGRYTNQIKDSAEIGLIKFNVTSQELLFSGAKRPLVHIRNGVVNLYKGAKCILGNSQSGKELLTNQKIEIQKDDMIYMFSDGFPDQFGGDKDSKFLTKNLLLLLQNVAPLSINQQYEEISETFLQWKGEKNQIDDVLLLGFKV